MSLQSSEQVAARLRGELAAAGLSYADVAGRLHVSRMWVHRRLRAERPQPMTLEEITALADIVGVSAVEIVTLPAAS